MNIIQLYTETLTLLEESFHALERRIESPQLRQLGFGAAYRYPTQSIKAAVIQKLARVISGLNACMVLLEKGLVQELGALQRMLDEFCEDLTFLCQPLIGGERTTLHDLYLQHFYQEEIDSHGNPFLSKQKRPQIPREKIQAANARTAVLNPSDAQELTRSLNKAYGGYVHGASPHIMEMYGGVPPRFHVSGMLDTPRIEKVTKDLWNYFHRGLNTAELVAQGLGDTEVAQRILVFRGDFEGKSGKSAKGEASAVMARVKAVRDPSDA